jgi:pimeloyl-ACP methyl ester carboxylesterase
VARAWPGQGIADPTKVPPAERTALSFHDPRKGFGVPNEAQLAMMAENQKTLRVYAGASLFSQTLRAEVAALRAPTLVAWGESDKIVDVAYGKLWVESIPGARFHAVPEAGHFPQIEQPDEVAALITGFAAQL